MTRFTLKRFPLRPAGLSRTQGRQKCARSDLADDESAAAFCADILAALIDLDYHRAEKSATRLVRQCEAKLFSKFECTLFAHWARTAAMVARRDDSVLNKQFQKYRRCQEGPYRP
jgi:hypothetical protein